MNRIDDIINHLQALTLQESSDLVRKIEELFGVDASRGNDMIIPSLTPTNSLTEEQEEKTEFDLILLEVPADKKIAILKVVRSIAGLGLKESKVLVEAAPQKVQGAMTKDAAETGKKQLEAAGAKVEIL